MANQSIKVDVIKMYPTPESMSVREIFVVLLALIPWSAYAQEDYQIDSMVTVQGRSDIDLERLTDGLYRITYDSLRRTVRRERIELVIDTFTTIHDDLGSRTMKVEVDYRPGFLVHGEVVDYWPNGATKSHGMMEHGLKEGVWFDYGPDSIEISRHTFQRGMRVIPYRSWAHDHRR